MSGGAANQGAELARLKSQVNKQLKTQRALLEQYREGIMQYFESGPLAERVQNIESDLTKFLEMKGELADVVAGSIAAQKDVQARMSAFDRLQDIQDALADTQRRLAEKEALLDEALASIADLNAKHKDLFSTLRLRADSKRRPVRSVPSLPNCSAMPRSTTRALATNWPTPTSGPTTFVSS